MALPFVANFTGAAAALVDPPYKDLRAGTGPTTNSKDGSGNAVSTTISIDCVSVDDSNTYTNGQSAQATLNSTLSSGNDYLYLVVNGSGNTGAATVYWFWTNGVNDTALNRNAGSAWASAVTETTANTTTASAGDVFKLSHDGSGHVTVTKNGSIIAALSFTDATPLTGGAPGFGTSSVTTVTTVKISAFTGDDVSSGITLTGQTGTFTEGTISRAITKALTGQTATFTEGTISASTGGNVTLSLTGQTATFTEGTLGLNIGYTLNDGVPLTGQTASFTEGTPTGSISYTLGSQSATFTEGTIARAVSSALVGQSGTFTEGTITRAASYPLVAQTATFTEGTISASSGGNVTLSLSGQTASFSEGTIAPTVSLALLGQSTTYTPGSLTGSLSAALQGQTGTFSEGTITAQATGDVTRSLFGQTATFTEGIITSNGTGAGRHRKRYAVRDGYKLLLFETRKQAKAYEASIQPKATPAQIQRAIKVRPTEKLDLTPLKAVLAFKTALASHDYEAIEKLARDHEEEEVAKNLLTQIRRESMDLSREITALLPNLMKTLRKKRNELRNRRKT